MARLKARRRPRRTAPPVTAAPGTAAFLQSLPAEAPVAMPEQDLSRAAGPRASAMAGGGEGRRAVLLAATAALTVAAAVIVGRLLAPGGFSGLDAATLALSTVLFAWTAFGFISACAGFVRAWRGADLSPWSPQPIIFTRTALLLPTYNEDPGRILSAVQAMYEDLRAMGVAELYDLFILSDSRDEKIAEAEATGLLRLRLRLGGEAGIYYRRRVANTDRKAGNIAEWVRRFGGAYESMLILDADSVMTADTIVRLTAEMEGDPKLGLLQTLPTIIGAETLFGRLQQFAARVYGPVVALGQDWWSGTEGNYWGHNAIIRTRAFADHAGLPHLPGRRPFGGHIMSHDFVEAALLRRGGWSVRMAATLPGSYEETPPTLLDMAIRDRRWCQGNLQHAAILGAGGLHWVSRLHLLRGVLSYATSPLWLAMLVAGAGVWMRQGPGEAAESGQAAAWLFALTMSLLLAPKLMAALLTVRTRADRRGCGGSLRFAASVVGETAASILIAPALMLMQSAAVADVLLGRDSGWVAQQRDHAGAAGEQAWRTHRGTWGSAWPARRRRPRWIPRCSGGPARCWRGWCCRRRWRRSPRAPAWGGCSAGWACS